MRLPNAAHTSRPWRIHELAADFRLEDVWALPTPGGRHEFPRLVALIASSDPSRSSSAAVRTLFAIRWRLGALLGWDDQVAGDGPPRSTLRDRVPADLRESRSSSSFEARRFRPLYCSEDEWAAEIVNRTVHAIMHLGWVRVHGDTYRGQMAVLVKPNGLLGSSYMAAIAPFRRFVVYPRILREVGRQWRARAAQPAPTRV
jgi:hypothetical protein